MSGPSHHNVSPVASARPLPPSLPPAPSSTHRNATPATPVPSETVCARASLCADLAANTRGQVSLYPVMSVGRGGRRKVGISGALLAVVEGHLLAVSVGIVLAH